MGAILHRIKRLKLEAKGWRPSRKNGIPPVTFQTRAEMHTRLDCCLLEMFIGRPFILIHRPDQQSGQSNAQASSSAPARSRDPQAEDQECLVEDCISAAEDAIDMCYTLQTGDLGLTRSSYLEYSSCRAALLVLIAYSICYRTNKFSVRLQRGLDAIREMASTGDSARSEISLLETLEAALHHLHVFDRNSEATESPGEKDLMQDDYDGFVAWYKNRGSSVASGSHHDTTVGILSQPAPFDTTGSSLAGAKDTGNDVLSASQWLGPDFFNTGDDSAFFNADSSGHDTLEKDLLDSLLWIPD